MTRVAAAAAAAGWPAAACGARLLTPPLPPRPPPRPPPMKIAPCAPRTPQAPQSEVTSGPRSSASACLWTRLPACALSPALGGRAACWRSTLPATTKASSPPVLLRKSALTIPALVSAQTQRRPSFLPPSLLVLPRASALWTRPLSPPPTPAAPPVATPKTSCPPRQSRPPPPPRFPSRRRRQWRISPRRPPKGVVARRPCPCLSLVRLLQRQPTRLPHSRAS